MSSNRIMVETATESAVKRAMYVAAVMALVALAGFAVLVAYNLASIPARRWFRAIPFTAGSWLSGLFIGLGLGWRWIYRDGHPDLAAWWPAVLVVTLVILRCETMTHRREEARTYANNEQGIDP